MIYMTKMYIIPDTLSMITAFPPQRSVRDAVWNAGVYGRYEIGHGSQLPTTS